MSVVRHLETLIYELLMFRCFTITKKKLISTSDLCLNSMKTTNF